MLESLLPETIPLTDEQFNTYLYRTFGNKFGRDKLAEIIAEGARAVGTPPKSTTENNNPKSQPTKPDTANDNNADPQGQARKSLPLPKQGRTYVAQQAVVPCAPAEGLPCIRHGWGRLRSPTPTLHATTQSHSCGLCRVCLSAKPKSKNITHFKKGVIAYCNISFICENYYSWQG